jgi:hypothetical protein
VSRVHAALLDPDLRLDSIVAQVRTHDWVQDARRAAQATILLVPSAAGVRELRCRGKRHLVAVMEQHLQRPPGAGPVPVDWRLVESLPTPGQPASAGDSGPAWMPIISDLVLDRGSRSLACQLRVPYDLPIFDGHFPSKPIVPGVIQVGWAVELARANGLATGRFAGISTAKFRRLLQPGLCLAAHLDCSARSGQLEFTYRLGESIVTIGRLQFEGCDD